MSTPHVLLPYQQRWVEDTSQIRVYEKSRRIGASWVCACEAVLDAAVKNPVSTFYLGYNREMASEFIRDTAHWAKSINAVVSDAEEFVLDEDKDVLAYRVNFASGGRVTALSSRPTNLRGKKGNIIIDEASWHQDLGGLLSAAMAALMWGGRVSILSTHNGVDSEFNKFIEDIRAGKRSGSIHTTSIDDAIDDGLFKRICLVSGQTWSKAAERAWLDELLKSYGDAADEELRCIPSKSGGQYIDRLIIEDRLVDGWPVLRFEPPTGFAARPDDQRRKYMLDWLKSHVEPVLKRLPKDRPHFFGEDFGRTIDISVIAPCYTTKELHLAFPFLLEMRNTPFLEQELALTFVVDRLPKFCYGTLDATGNGQFLAERAWQCYGESKIEMVNLSRQWYAENLPRFKASFEDDLVQVPRDEDVVNDLLAFRRVKGIPLLPDVRQASVADAAKGKFKTRHGDSAIALLLGHYASKQPVLLTSGYKSASKRTMQSSSAGKWGGGFRSRKGSVL